ncbi:MAG: right-handed parallel beta-helix repeat-containing protein [Planctomycetes bacterium]|nr:right-handed parallel beta-helix repeat-containing protein [Planctomycetota bacterium]
MYRTNPTQSKRTPQHPSTSTTRTVGRGSRAEGQPDNPRAACRRRGPAGVVSDRRMPAGKRLGLLRLGLLLVSALAASGASGVSAVGAVLHVDALAAGSNDGSSWADAFTDLQTALATSISGDEIWVASGTYAPAGPDGDRAATFQLVSGVGVYGGFSGTEAVRDRRNPAAYVTVLSGDLNANDHAVSTAADLANELTRSDNSFHVTTGTGADETAVLDGFVITAGHANGPGAADGGGMLNAGVVSTVAHPTVINCMFEWNFAWRNGGGLYNRWGDLTLSNCTFRHNHANAGGGPSFELGGGGMSNVNANPVMSDCTFSLNTTASNGAGLHNLSGSPTIIHCRFDENKTADVSAPLGGGGMFTRAEGSPVLMNCTFTGNFAIWGGGLRITRDSAPIIINCAFSGNVGVQSSAGISLNNGGTATIINCTVSGNSTAGGGIGAGIEVGGESNLILKNCVLWGNTSGGISDRRAQITHGLQSAQVPDISHSCVQGGWDEGIGNIDLDPLFRDADGPDNIIGTADDDLRLTGFSPCIDTGDNVSLPADSADLDGDGDTAEAIPIDLKGNQRVRGSWIDMGAYEYELAVTAGGPSPIDRADDISRDVVLAWQPGVSAQTHNVYLGTSWDDVDAATPDTIAAVGLSQETHSLDVGRLAFDQTYYWRVDEVNGAPDYTEFKGATWSFTTEPFAYPITAIAVSASSTSGPDTGPEKTIDGSGLVDDLHGIHASDMWVSGGLPATIEYTFDRAYKLHQLWVWNSNQLIEAFVGFGAKDVVIEHSLNGIDWVALEGFAQLAQAPGVAGYALNNVIDLEGVMASAVRITINSVHGFAPQTGLSEVQFFHVPVLARQPQPAVGTTLDSLDTVLSWRPGREADLHEVLFSENRDAVEDGSALIATTTVAWLDLSDLNLQYGTTYYWKVNEVNALENPPVHEGDVWSFTTPEFGSIDGVE